MLSEADLPQDLREGLWTEAAFTATKFDAIMVYPTESMSAHETFYGVPSKLHNHLKVFGEICIAAKIDRSMQKKILDHCKPCIFVGYADHHTSNI